MTRTIALAAAVLLALALPAYAQDGGKDGAKAATQPKTEQKTEPKTEPASTPGSSTAPAEKTAAPAAPAAERESPFVGMAGSWSGGGTLSMSGSRERMRCRANHSVSKDGNSLSMNIRCASDSANISLSSHVTYRNGRCTAAVATMQFKGSAEARVVVHDAYGGQSHLATSPCQGKV